MEEDARVRMFQSAWLSPPKNTFSALTSCGLLTVVTASKWVLQVFIYVQTMFF